MHQNMKKSLYTTTLNACLDVFIFMCFRERGCQRWTVVWVTVSLWEQQSYRVQRNQEFASLSLFGKRLSSSFTQNDTLFASSPNEDFSWTMSYMVSEENTNAKGKILLTNTRLSYRRSWPIKFLVHFYPLHSSQFYSVVMMKKNMGITV